MRPGDTAELRFDDTRLEVEVAQVSSFGWVGGCTCCRGETVALVGPEVLEVRSRAGTERFADFEVVA
jgi:hypothetical protein